MTSLQEQFIEEGHISNNREMSYKISLFQNSNDFRLIKYKNCKNENTIAQSLEEYIRAVLPKENVKGHLQNIKRQNINLVSK